MVITRTRESHNATVPLFDTYGRLGVRQKRSDYPFKLRATELTNKLMTEEAVVSDIVETLLRVYDKRGRGSLSDAAVLVQKGMELAEEYEGNGAWRKRVVLASVTAVLHKTTIGSPQTDAAVDAAIIAILPGVIDLVASASKNDVKINQKLEENCRCLGL